MKKQIITLLSLICLFTVTACKKSDDPKAANGQTDFSDQVSPQSDTGTVDGGGGDAVTNPATGSGQLLDLAEEAEKEPFDYDIRSMFVEKYGDGYVKYWGAYQDMRFLPVTEKVMQDKADFYGWALMLSMLSNSERNSPYYDRSGDQIHIDAFDLKGHQVISNLQYAFTDKKLSEIADEGVIVIENPETKRQLAIQDGTGHVIINREEFNKLDFESKLALKLHESMLYLVLRFNPELIKQSGTAPIRKFVRDYFNYTYVSGIKGEPQISLDDMRKSFNALNLPLIRPDYSKIGLISDINTDESMICEFVRDDDGIPDLDKKYQPPYSNYHFEKKGKRISGSALMNVEYYMKVQLHLLKRGICVFKPKPCEVKYIPLNPIVHYNEPPGLFRIVRGDLLLPGDSNDAQYMYDVILEKYRVARICE